MGYPNVCRTLELSQNVKFLEIAGFPWREQEI